MNAIINILGKDSYLGYENFIPSFKNFLVVPEAKMSPY